jgi:hypothetical protein
LGINKKRIGQLNGKNKMAKYRYEKLTLSSNINISNCYKKIKGSTPYYPILYI